MRADPTFRCVPLFMIPTQHSLVARLREGASNTDWERFYMLYERPLLAFAASHSLDESDCRDVLQETMVKMLRGGFARFDPAKGPFTGFLFNVAKGCVIDAIRRRSRRESRQVSIDQPLPNQPPQPPVQIAAATATPAEMAERQGQIALIAITLDFLVEQRSFQPKTVAIFKAVTLEAAEPEEVARRFQTSVGNVYEAKRAVLSKLRKMLQALDAGCDLEQAEKC